MPRTQLLNKLNLTVMRKPIVLQTEGLGKQPFHGRIVLLVDRHTASAAEMSVAKTAMARMMTR